MTLTNDDVKKVQPKLRDGIHYTGDKGPKIGVRHVQVALASLGMGISFVYRITFSICIIAMTDNSSSTDADVPIYDWNNKSIILSATFWGSICLPFLSGYLGKQYGPKWFIFGAGLTDSIMFMLIPLGAKTLGSTGVIICRLIQGLVEGMILPLNTCVMGNWVPTEERSRMGFMGTAAVTTSLIASSIATGYIASSSLGWPWIFYIFGGIGLTWCAVFGLLAKQNPRQHKRITLEEKKYIEVSLNQKIAKDIPIPWRKIFTSIHVWAILVAQIGIGWVGITISTETSIFMTKVMQFGVKSNGLISALPPLSGLTGGIVISTLSDYIPRKKILSLLNSRRVFHTIGIVGLSTCFLMMTFVPVEHNYLAVVLICVGNVFLISCTVGGSDMSGLDISPKFAGIIFGCYSTISQSVSLGAPLIVQLLVTDETDATQWRTVYIISAAVAISTALFFDVFASATRQNWDGENEQEAKISLARRRSSLFNTGVVP